MSRHLILGFGVLWLGLAQQAYGIDWFGTTLEGAPCKGKDQAFGPYDYYDVNDEKDPLWQEGRLWEIDKVHTAKGLQVLAEGASITQAEFLVALDNLDYTLRAIPNHPEALQAMVRLDVIRRNSDGRLRSNVPPPECYFQRAATFRPTQEQIPLLFGLYLDSLGHVDKEIDQYNRALALNDKYAEAHYDLGLALIKKGKIDQAAEHARLAYQLGFPLPGLRRKLQALGHFEGKVTDPP